jgi:ATP-dependent protease HslVU (ClpYQ) peptidase subunit
MMYGTTILVVRHKGKVAVGGDGQVTRQYGHETYG